MHCMNLFNMSNQLHVNKNATIHTTWTVWTVSRVLISGQYFSFVKRSSALLYVLPRKFCFLFRFVHLFDSEIIKKRWKLGERVNRGSRKNRLNYGADLNLRSDKKICLLSLTLRDRASDLDRGQRSPSAISCGVLELFLQYNWVVSCLLKAILQHLQGIRRMDWYLFCGAIQYEAHLKSNISWLIGRTFQQITLQVSQLVLKRSVFHLVLIYLCG